MGKIYKFTEDYVVIKRSEVENVRNILDATSNLLYADSEKNIWNVRDHFDAEKLYEFIISDDWYIESFDMFIHLLKDNCKHNRELLEESETDAKESFLKKRIALADKLLSDAREYRELEKEFIKSNPRYNPNWLRDFVPYKPERIKI